MDVLTALAAAGAVHRREPAPPGRLRMANLSLEHGNSDGSCFAYVSLGMILGRASATTRRRPASASSASIWSRRAASIASRPGSILSFANVVTPWTQPVRAASRVLRRAFEAAQETGDLTFAAYARNTSITNLLAAGAPLGEVEREAEDALAFAQKSRLRPHRRHHHRAARAHPHAARPDAGLRLLRRRRVRAAAVRAPPRREPAPGDRRVPLLDPQAAGALLRRRLRGRPRGRREGGARCSGRRCRSSSWPSIISTPRWRAPRHCDALAAAERPRHLEALQAHHRQLAVWAENCPENFANRAALVGAEIARLEGRELDAERLYEEAIRSARARRLRPERGARQRARRALLRGARLRDDRPRLSAQRPPLLPALGRRRQGAAARAAPPASARRAGAARADRARSAHRSSSSTSRPCSRCRRPCRARSSSTS